MLTSILPNIGAEMEGAQYLRSGAFAPRHNQLLLSLVLLVVLARCGNGSSADTNTRTTHSPAKRMILTFDGLETKEGRLEYLRGVRDDGYACWLFPSTFSAAVCLQVDVVVGIRFHLVRDFEEEINAEIHPKKDRTYHEPVL